MFSRGYYLNDGFGNLCGAGYPDKYFGEVLDINHSSDTLSVRFTFGLDEDSYNGNFVDIFRIMGFSRFCNTDITSLVCLII